MTAINENPNNNPAYADLPLTWYYVVDPMCSWCYAFAPHWKKLRNQYPFPVKNIMGGLAPDSNTPMPDSMAKQIAGYWKVIEEKTGTKFNHDFWQQNTPYRSTYPACRAVITAGIMQHGKAEEMIAAIQSAYYQNAKNPALKEVLADCAESIGLDKNQFSEMLNGCATEDQLDLDFITRDKLGASGFPSLYLVDESAGRAAPVTTGYQPFESLKNTTESILTHLSQTAEKQS